MSDFQITLTIPEALAKRAQDAGILNNERIAALLAMELRREEAWETLNATAIIVQGSVRADLGPLSEDEVTQLVDEEIHLMRAEDDAREALNNPHTA